MSSASHLEHRQERICLLIQSVAGLAGLSVCSVRENQKKKKRLTDESSGEEKSFKKHHIVVGRCCKKRKVRLAADHVQS